MAEICREHPRFHNWCGPFVESGLGLCCEEACRLILTGREPFRLTRLEDLPDDPEETEEPLEPLLALRRRAFRLLEERPLPEALEALARLGYAAQHCPRRSGPGTSAGNSPPAPHRTGRGGAGGGASPGWSGSPMNGKGCSPRRRSIRSSSGPSRCRRIRRPRGTTASWRATCSTATCCPLAWTETFADRWCFRWRCAGCQPGWSGSAAAAGEQRLHLAKLFSKEVEYCEESLPALLLPSSPTGRRYGSGGPGETRSPFAYGGGGAFFAGRRGRAFCTEKKRSPQAKRQRCEIFDQSPCISTKRLV